MTIKNILAGFLVLLLFATGCSDFEINSNHEGKVIILMYHRLTTGEPANLYERSADDFEKDLKYLNDNDINVLYFNELEEYIIKGKMPAKNSAIITFDDGDYSWYTLARPLLLKYGMKATFFLWTGIVGSNSFLSWNEVELMANYMNEKGTRPFTFESHSFSHPYLLEKRSSFENMAEYEAFLDYELRESKKMIEEHVPDLVTVLALPYGDGAGDDIIIDAAARNGYRMIRTSRYGAIENVSVNLFNLPSLPMLDDTDPETIGQYLEN